MLRFTIRDLLWLMVVVALMVGWWLERRDKQLNTDAFIKSVEKDAIEHRREIDDLKARAKTPASPSNPSAPSLD